MSFALDHFRPQARFVRDSNLLSPHWRFTFAGESKGDSVAVAADPVDGFVEAVGLREDRAEGRGARDDLGCPRAREEGDGERLLAFAKTLRDVRAEAVAELEVEQCAREAGGVDVRRARGRVLFLDL